MCRNKGEKNRRTERKRVRKREGRRKRKGVYMECQALKEGVGEKLREMNGL